jgi:hypothetical protein
MTGLTEALKCVYDNDRTVSGLGAAAVDAADLRDDRGQCGPLLVCVAESGDRRLVHGGLVGAATAGRAVNASYIRMRAGAEIMQLAVVRPRRWWQLWKPRMVTVPLETAEYRLKKDDRVSLTQIGQCYAVTVNDMIVLQWPPEDAE